MELGDVARPAEVRALAMKDLDPPQVRLGASTIIALSEVVLFPASHAPVQLYGVAQQILGVIVVVLLVGLSRVRKLFLGAEIRPEGVGGPSQFGTE
jgi:hypothetical protein